MTDRPVALVAVVLTALAAACAAPTTSDAEVRRQARLSVEAASSEVATVDLVARTQLAGEVWHVRWDDVVGVEPEVVRLRVPLDRLDAHDPTFRRAPG